jgi:Arc/MetJ-type ribon-helix-helix transcriptional regulator
MATLKIAITIEEQSLRELDSLVARGDFPSRSRAIQEAVAEKLARLTRSRLATQCSLLEPGEERDLAEEFSPDELQRWLEC